MEAAVRGKVRMILGAIRIGAVTIGVVALTACTAPAPTAPPAEQRADCITGFDPARDYFPVKAEFAHATNVSLRYERSYQVLTIKQPYPGGAPESYVLLRCGAPMPTLPPELLDAPVIETPVRSLYAESTTQLPLLVDVGALDVLTGVGVPDLVSGPEVRARIDAGQVVGFADDGQLEVEAVLTADPDVLLSQGVNNPGFPALRSAGIPVIGWAEYLDVGPLGQAEWIKVVGALTGREVDAARVFGEIEGRYAEVAAAVAGVAPTPVLLGQLYQGSWSVPAGASSTGTLVRDAGGTWSEAANPSAAAVAKDFELVFTTDGGAPVWLADGPFPTRADVLAADPRYGELAAVRGGQIWTRDKAVGATGGNDFFERGITRPDEVLADLVAILHPDRLPGHETVFHQRVTG
jgi:iron complex transport system substrate-binding protein